MFLMVEDNSSQRRRIRRILGEAGYGEGDFVVVSTIQEAKNQLQQHADEIKAIICEMPMMTEPGGKKEPEASEEFLAMAGLPVLMISAASAIYLKKVQNEIQNAAWIFTLDADSQLLHIMKNFEQMGKFTR